MEDNTSTTDSELNTNPNEDVELEDIEVTEEELASIDKPDEEVEEPEVEPEQQESEVEETTEDEVQDEKSSEDDKSSPSSEEVKAHNKLMAEQRIREKQIREAQIKQAQQQYVAEAEDEQSLALRQLQVDAYTNKVESNTNKLQNGYEKAIKDFPILADSTPEIKAEVDAAIDAFQAMYVKIDKFGNPSEISGDLYKYLQSKADSIERLTQIGARKQLTNKAKEKSKTFTPPSRTPKEPKIDLDLKAFEEEASRW